MASSLRLTTALRLRFLRARLHPAALSLQPIRQSSSFTDLDNTLQKRVITPTFDDLTPGPSHRLHITLSDHLPSSHKPSSLPPSSSTPLPLPLAHHLVYFEPLKLSRDLLPDGTDIDQSPGPPFERRMWAGGRVAYAPRNEFKLDGGRAVCAQFLRSAKPKGREGEEKVFVAVERRLAKLTAEEGVLLEEALLEGREGKDGEGEAEGSKCDLLHHRVRQRLWRAEADDLGPCSLVETRNIVFMCPRNSEQAAHQASHPAGSGSRSTKILRPTYDLSEADWTHTLTPDAVLLFRFSALTFNAHSIHLDPGFSKEVEGHRGMLVHGPLSYVLLMTLLSKQLKPGEQVVRVEYRNLAPLYCHEPVTYCGKRTGERKWDVWALTPEGGMAIKGTVMTEMM